MEGYYAAQIRVTTQLGGMPTSQTMYRCEGVENKALRSLDLNFVADLGHSARKHAAVTYLAGANRNVWTDYAIRKAESWQSLKFLPYIMGCRANVTERA